MDFGNRIVGYCCIRGMFGDIWLGWGGIGDFGCFVIGNFMRVSFGIVG